MKELDCEFPELRKTNSSGFHSGLNTAKSQPARTTLSSFRNSRFLHQQKMSQTPTLVASAKEYGIGHILESPAPLSSPLGKDNKSAFKFSRSSSQTQPSNNEMGGGVHIATKKPEPQLLKLKSIIQVNKKSSPLLNRKATPKSTDISEAMQSGSGFADLKLHTSANRKSSVQSGRGFFKLTNQGISTPKNMSFSNFRPVDLEANHHVPNALIETLTTENQDYYVTTESSSTRIVGDKQFFSARPDFKLSRAPFLAKPQYSFSSRAGSKRDSRDSGYVSLESESSEAITQHLFEQISKTGFDFEKKNLNNKMWRKQANTSSRESGINEGMYFTSKISVKASVPRRKPMEVGEVINFYGENPAHRKSMHFPQAYYIRPTIH